MASHGISFSLDDITYDRLLAEQQREGRTGISPDLFAKEKLCEFLDPEGKPGKKRK